MSNCINKNHPDVAKLAGELNILPAVAAAKIGVWQSKNNIFDRFPTKDELNKKEEVNYNLKAVDILSSDKAKQVFAKGEKAGWDLNKILTELQIPKDQKALLLDLNITDREQLALELSSNYSYSIEINTATKDKNVEEGFESIDNRPVPTTYYSNLTVPGGTNGSYIEANIETPMIVPSIQSHAQFKTDNTIGWMRADEKQNYQERDIDNLIEIMKKSGILEINCG